MSEHSIKLLWTKQTDSFAFKDYNRDHQWDFGDGLLVKASSAPQFMGNPECADPEQGFAASLSSCHMLFFIAICSKKRLIVESYTDNATAVLEANEQGALLITKVILKPEVIFAEGVEVSREVLNKIHHQSHEKCFLANSVKSEIIIAPVL